MTLAELEAKQERARQLRANLVEQMEEKKRKEVKQAEQPVSRKDLLS